MEGPSENQIPQEEAPTKQTDELIHVNLEDEVKCNDKQDDGDKGKKGSVVWDYFNKIPGCPVGKQKAKCSLCNVIIGCFSRNGTSAMMNHLKTVCPKSPLRNNLDKLQKTLRFEIISKEDKSRTLKAHAFNQERLRKKVALMCIKDNQPFRIVEHLDILVWWKVNSTRFPILSEIARHVLGMPVSSVASEAAFSTGGRTIDAYRSSLSPKTAEALVCSQDWLRSSESVIDLRGEPEEYLQHEKLENDEVKVVVSSFEYLDIDD